MDNPETSSTLGTQYTGRRQKTNKNTTQKTKKMNKLNNKCFKWSNKCNVSIVLNEVIKVLNEVIRDYYMTFSISALILAWDSHIKPDIKAGGLIPGMIWKISCQSFYHIFYIDLSKHWLLYCKKDLWTDKLRK
jgi:hypothetical protein